MSLRESTGDLVRRVVAHELRVDRNGLCDSFRWIDDVTREDAGWLLESVQDALLSEVFPPYITDEELERIGTIGSPVAYVETKLAKSK